MRIKLNRSLASPGQPGRHATSLRNVSEAFSGGRKTGLETPARGEPELLVQVPDEVIVAVHTSRAWNVLAGMCSLGPIRSWFGGRRLIPRCVFLLPTIKYRTRTPFPQTQPLQPGQHVTNMQAPGARGALSLETFQGQRKRQDTVAGRAFNRRGPPSVKRRMLGHDPGEPAPALELSRQDSTLRCRQLREEMHARHRRWDVHVVLRLNSDPRALGGAPPPSSRPSFPNSLMGTPGCLSRCPAPPMAGGVPPCPRELILLTLLVPSVIQQQAHWLDHHHREFGSIEARLWGLLTHPPLQALVTSHSRSSSNGLRSFQLQGLCTSCPCVMLSHLCQSSLTFRVLSITRNPANSAEVPLLSHRPVPLPLAYRRPSGHRPGAPDHRRPQCVHPQAAAAEPDTALPAAELTLTLCLGPNPYFRLKNRVTLHTARWKPHKGGPH